MKFDLHVHSQYSWDSQVSIESYIKQAEKLNFDVISITDHNSTESHSIIDTLQSKTDVILIPGQEVSTKDGHLLVYGWLDTIERDLSMKDVVRIAKRQNGYCIAAHPFDPFRGGSFSKIFNTEIDGFELLNASAWFGFPNWLARRAYRKYPDLIGLGNSDSHRLNEFGVAYSTVEDFPYQSIPDFFDHLKQAIPAGNRIGMYNKLKRFLGRKFS